MRSEELCGKFSAHPDNWAAPHRGIRWAQGRRVQGHGIAVADELVRRNRMLGAAIRALTGEHAATCAAASAGREALSQLQRAHDQLQDQVGPWRMYDNGSTSHNAIGCDDDKEFSSICKPCNPDLLQCVQIAAVGSLFPHLSILLNSQAGVSNE